jgi:hypothetical protein
MGDMQQQQPERGLTFDDVWAMLKETDRIVKENALQMQETDRRMKETDRQMKETDRKMKETDRKISNLGSRLGELVEEIVFPNIVEKFNKLGYVFGKAATRVRYQNPQGVYVAEVDILLENGDSVLAVEVKTLLTGNDVRDHIQRMEKLRVYADGHGDKRKLLGAVAGGIASEEVKAFAIKSGFFVLEQTGDTVRISVPEGFSPRIW